MLTRILLVVLMAVSTSLLSSGCKKTEDQVIEQSEAFSQACDQKNADLAMMILADESFTYFDEICNKARTLSAGETKKLSPTEMSEVIMVRNRFKKEEIAKLTGREFAYACVSKGWWGGTSTDYAPEWEYSGFKVKGKRATLEFVVYDTVGKRFVEYVKQDGKWKLDWSANNSSSDADFRYAASQMQKSIEDTILAIEAKQTGKSVKSGIWDPVK